MQSRPKLPKPWTRAKSLAGDASSRQYWRIWDGDDRTAILAWYPRAVRDQLPQDLEVRAWCSEQGLRVPELHDYSGDEGWVVVEDFGPDDAEARLAECDPDERRALTQICLRPLAVLAELSSDRLPKWNPPLDGARLRWELAGFELWFLRHHLGTVPPPTVGKWLDEIAEAIDHHPKRVCHRDYHLNNLFILADDIVGVIDYQDILVGPDTYDAVSLLGERSLPRLLGTTDRTLVQNAWARETVALPGWQERWPLVRMQRALKVLGTFARFDAEGVGGYRQWMEDLAVTIGPELVSLDAPSVLVDLLLDLSRRHDIGAGRNG
jgi:aminoglycoside/choline kinase family phosphotransferase